MYENNSFVTLTYNDDHLPENGSIQKVELQNFIKRLRKEIYPKKVRFFGCGEYGEKLNRPHYHACLFGYDFSDKEALFHARRSEYNGYIRKKRGECDLYRSKTLEKVWDKGFSTIGEVSYESAGYVARYVCKKIDGDMAKKHYKGKQEEFALMSRMPGIGKKWIEKYLRDVYPKDFVTVNGKKVKPPRYYDTQLEKYNMMEMRSIRKKRREQSLAKRPETTLRNRAKEYHLKCVTKSLQRGFENAGD